MRAAKEIWTGRATNKTYDENEDEDESEDEDEVEKIIKIQNRKENVK